jgi:hypothetical protein
MFYGVAEGAGKCVALGGTEKKCQKPSCEEFPQCTITITQQKNNLEHY